MNVGIVGYGVVGKALAKIFGKESSDPNLRIYDKGLAGLNNAKSKAAIQTCDLVFVAVPTPESQDGACDVSAVREVVEWVKPPMCIKSTVPPGTVDGLVAATGKSICFSPEYVGETKWHPLKGIETHGFIIVGGAKPACDLVVRVYQKFLGPLPHLSLIHI